MFYLSLAVHALLRKVFEALIEVNVHLAAHALLRKVFEGLIEVNVHGLSHRCDVGLPQIQLYWIIHHDLGLELLTGPSRSAVHMSLSCVMPSLPSTSISSSPPIENCSRA